MDWSEAIALCVPFIGMLVALVLGSLLAKRGSPTILWPAVGIGIALGMLLTIVQVLGLGVCIELLKLCKSHGDGNLSYWFQSLIAIPLFSAATFVAWRLTPEDRF